MLKKLNQQFLNLQGKYYLMKSKLNFHEKRLYPLNSVKYLGIRIDKFLHWHDQVNNIAVKLNRANALLLKIRNYVKMKTLRNIYFTIFDSHLTYSVLFGLGTLIQ